MGERESKMTQREFFNAVINGTVNAEMVEFAQNEITKLDTRNAKRNEKREDKHLEERIAITNVLALADKPMLASEIATATKMTTQKVSGLLGRMDGITVTDVKVKGGKRKGYTLA